MSDVDKLRLTRERDRIVVNGFLEHPDVDHDLGGVPGARAMFGARRRSDQELIAVCVLGRPYSRFIDQDKEIMIIRLAALPSRPANTGSWLIAKARQWAYLEGYERITSLAGIADNTGVVYRAAGFELVDGYPKIGSGVTWKSQGDDRKGHGEYTKYRYVYRLRDPADVPDSVDRKWRDQSEIADVAENQVPLGEWST